MVAAIALRNSLPVVTGNVAHFEQVRAARYDLVVENWRATYADSACAPPPGLAALSSRSQEVAVAIAFRVDDVVQATDRPPTHALAEHLGTVVAIDNERGAERRALSRWLADDQRSSASVVSVHRQTEGD